MAYTYLLWIATAAYMLHVLEEFTYNWRDWAINYLHLPVDWTNFYLTNAAVIVLGVCAAMIGWHQPAISLAFPALMIINAVFFHILPTVRDRHFSPGLLTGLVLQLPVALWVFYGAAQDGVLTAGTTAIAFALGAAVMAYPVVLLQTKRLPVFGQAKPARQGEPQGAAQHPAAPLR